MSPPLKSAPHACRTCRRLKRRCNKALPTCSQCSRLQKMCEYPYLPSPESATSPTLADRLQNLEQLIEAHAGISSRTNGTGQQDPAPCPEPPFPASFFLDSDFLQPLGPNELSLGYQSILEQAVASHIGLDPARDAIVAAYLVSTHRWLPMVSKKLFKSDCNGRGGSSDGSTSLLILAMKLCTAPLAADRTKARDSQLYKLTSSLCTAAETSGAISLRLIQSLVLLAVFEISHAIYPAAYLTVGRVARLATVAGLHNRKSAHQLFKPADTWSSWEEHRRTWWAIFVLDRFVSIGTSGLRLATPEPSSGDLLPVNDDDWDQGKIVPNEPLYTKSFSCAATVGSFARTCQAAHILGKVLAHQEAKKSSEDVEALLSEAWHLHHALGALQSTLEQGDEAGRLCSLPGQQGAEQWRREASRLSALSLCASARVLLYNNYGCNDPSAPVVERIPQETEMQQVSYEGIVMVASITARSVAQSIVSHHGATSLSYQDDQDEKGDKGDKGDQGVTAWSPFLAQFVYHAATECAWFVREDHEARMYDALRDVVRGLEVLSRRWGLGVEYMALLEQGDVLKLI